tara:strand:+ start:154 stop:987 length:834 start_codon:yes stop_codon:yes gene_type:complete
MTRARDLAAFVSNADGDIKFDTDTLFIDSSANKVGIGRTDPAHPLDIQNDSASRHLRVFRNASGTSAIMVQNSDTGSGSSDGLQLSVISGGDAQVANLENTNLRFLTNSTERMRILADGGLTFNGDTAAANALDDYEEGTFTPSYTTSSSDASGVNYGTSNAGAYIKIGRLIHFQLTLHILSASSFGSGTPQIHGLPYTSSGSTPTNNSLRFTISTYDVNFDGGAGQTIHAYIPTTNVSYLQVLTTNDDTVWVVNNTGRFILKNNSFTTIAGMYLTN